MKKLVVDHMFQKIPKRSVQHSRPEAILYSDGNLLFDGTTEQNAALDNTSRSKHDEVNNAPIEKLGSNTQIYAEIVAFSAVRAHTRSSMGNFDIQHVRFDRTITVVGYGWNPSDSYFQ